MVVRWTALLLPLAAQLEASPWDPDGLGAGELEAGRRLAPAQPAQGVAFVDFDPELAEVRGSVTVTVG